MKKYLTLGILLTCVNTFAQYNPWNFTVLEMSIIKSNGNPNGWGPDEKDTFLELQGTTRYKLLDLYWFVDRSNIFNDSNLSDKKNVDKNYIYGEFNPRISLDGLFNKDLSIGIANEWFLAYNFDYDSAKGNGIKRHYVGLGNYLSIPKFDYFKTNIYARYITENYGRTENQWDGYMFNASYGAPIYKFENGMKFAFSGWLDYIFGAKTYDGYNKQSSDSLQWQNQIRFFFNENLSVSYTYQINNHFAEVNQNTSNHNNHGFGIHYSITF